MSVRALTWSFNLYLQDVTAKAILHALADHADENGRCWPSVARMALYAGCDEKTARRALGRLVALGLIAREARSGRSDVFTLHVGDGVSIRDHSQNREDPKTTPPIEAQTPDFKAQTPDFKAHDPSQNWEPNLLEPSVTKKITVKSATRSSDERLGTRLPADWQPAPTERDFAADLNLDPEATASTFRDYWAAIPGAKGRKTDWPATWRNWCRRDADNRRTPARGGAGIRPSPIRDESSAFARAADILAGR